MKLAEAWRLSKAPYREVVYQSLAEEKGRMWWGAFGQSQPGKEDQNERELAERALRIAKFDKVIVSIFNVIVALVPFAAMLMGFTGFGLASSIALSLAVTLGFTALYAIQTFSSFVGAESSVLLSVLPIERNDFSLITLFSFIRSVDYMVIGSIVSQVMLVTYLTLSPIASLIMFAVAVMNQVFAVTLALGFSRLFQKNLLRGGRSKANTLLRLIFILLWGLLLVSVAFMFIIPLYAIPNLESLLFGGDVSNLLLNLLYPFSAGTIIASVTYSNVAWLIVIVSSFALAGYAMLAVIADKWSLGTVKSITQGAGKKTIRIATKDFSVKTHRPLSGYILKDLKVASRNPATAFFFALPVLETLLVSLLVSNQLVLRTGIVLEATLMGSIFALLIPLALLTAEGKGFEYTKTLPINTQKIVISKTLVSTATYIQVPLVLMGLSFFKPLTSISSILIPCLITLSVASASIFEIKIFLRGAAKNKIGAVVNDLEKIVTGFLTIVIPVVVYSVVFLVFFNHVLSLLSIGFIVLSELAIAVYLLRRT